MNIKNKGKGIDVLIIADEVKTELEILWQDLLL